MTFPTRIASALAFGAAMLFALLSSSAHAAPTPYVFAPDTFSPLYDSYDLAAGMRFYMSGSLDIDLATHQVSNINITFSGIALFLGPYALVGAGGYGGAGLSGNAVTLMPGLTRQYLQIEFDGDPTGEFFPLANVDIDFCGPWVQQYTFGESQCDNLSTWAVAQGGLVLDPVPEPSALALLALSLGILTLAAWGRRAARAF